MIRTMQGPLKEPKRAEAESELEVTKEIDYQQQQVETFGLVTLSRGFGSLEPLQVDESKPKSPQFKNVSMSNSSTDKNKSRFCHQENQPCPKEINRKIRQLSAVQDKTRNVSGGHTTAN